MQAPERFWIENSDKDMLLVDSEWRIYATLIRTPGLVHRPGTRNNRTSEFTLTYITEDSSIFEGKFYSTSQRDRAIKIAEDKAITPTNQFFYHRIA